MSSKLEPVIWLCDTGHIGIHGGVDGRTIVWSYCRTVTKTKFSRIDGLPYFLNYGALHVHALESRAPLQSESKACWFLLFCFSISNNKIIIKKRGGPKKMKRAGTRNRNLFFFILAYNVILWPLYW